MENLPTGLGTIMSSIVVYSLRKIWQVVLEGQQFEAKVDSDDDDDDDDDNNNDNNDIIPLIK